PRLSYILHQYESQSNVQINLKQFHDTESLFEELELVATENTLPDLIEMDPYQGINLFDQYNPIPLEKLAPGMHELFHHSIADDFTSGNRLLAYPLGMEIPLLLTNKSFYDSDSNMEIHPFSSEENMKEYRELQNAM